MGRNQGKRSIRHEQKHQGHEDRYHDRQAGNLGQDERRFILVCGTGPFSQRMCLNFAMMATVSISPGMEIKRPRLRLFPVSEARGADHRRRETDTDEQTSQQGNESRYLPGPAIVMHEMKQIRHSPRLSHEKVATLQNNQEARLPASAYRYYRNLVDIERRGHEAQREMRSASPLLYSTQMTVKAMAWAASRCLASLVMKGIVSPEAA